MRSTIDKLNVPNGTLQFRFHYTESCVFLWPTVRGRIEESKSQSTVERGDSLSHAANASGIFPSLVLQMMAVGEETGEMTRLLEEVSGFYQREVDFRLRKLTAMLEPMLFVAVGGMVLVLALGVFLPMWNLIGKIGHVG